MNADHPMAAHDEVTPAESLEGLELESGWVVLKKVERLNGQTGGHFSVGYLARNIEDHSLAFLKALDFSEALQSDDLLSALDEAVGTFRFEKEMLELCADHGMTHVVRALDSGFVRVDGGPLGRVPYLLFEPAEGDVRRAITNFGSVDRNWAISLLHEVSVGLQQMHLAQVAHQDLKPSNVLTYDSAKQFKISDLGCSSLKGRGCPRDGKKVPGGWSVAPPELQYGELSPDWIVRRVAADLYALGSLGVFLFTGLSMNAVVRAHIAEGKDCTSWMGTFRDVFPFVRDAYERAFNEISTCFEDPISVELFAVLKELCEPDPSLRGSLAHRGNALEQYAVQRYVSRLALLARRVAFAEKVIIRNGS